MNVVNDDHHASDSLQRETQQTGPKNTNEASQRAVSLKMFGIAMFVMFLFCVMASTASGIIVYNLVLTKGESTDKVRIIFLFDI